MSGRIAAGRFQTFRCHEPACARCCGRRPKNAGRYIDVAERLLTREGIAADILLLTTPPTRLTEIKDNVGRIWGGLRKLADRAGLRVGRLASSTTLEIEPTDGEPDLVHLHAHHWSLSDANTRPTSPEEIDANLPNWWQSAMNLPAAAKAGCQRLRNPIAGLVYTCKHHYDPAAFLGDPKRFLELINQTQGLRLHSVGGQLRAGSAGFAYSA